jgi:hypothetical protein
MNNMLTSQALHQPVLLVQSGILFSVLELPSSVLPDYHAGSCTCVRMGWHALRRNALLTAVDW